MSATALVLPFVWATAALPQPPSTQPVEPQLRHVPPEMGFYRKYTEGLLRRYVRMSMEAGKVPSLLGKEMLRSRVTSYRIEGFDDVVIFLSDVDRCLARLDEEQRGLVVRIALQEYTIEETAQQTGIRPKTVVRRYRLAINRLTRLFLEAKMLVPQTACQEEGVSAFAASRLV